MSVGVTVLPLWAPRLADRVGAWRPAVSAAGRDVVHVTMRRLETQQGADRMDFTGSLFFWLDGEDRFEQTWRGTGTARRRHPRLGRLKA
jgi:hypothetical protein